MKSRKKVYEHRAYTIDGLKINEQIMNQFLNKTEKKYSDVNDLNDIHTKSGSEILNIFSQMMLSKNYFKYCSSLLININPGPNNIQNYLNLNQYSLKKPHLYTFIQNVYKTMTIENKDQVVNLLGHTGSGKTFNLIHIIEFFTIMYSPKNFEKEINELIHNSIQLIHIFGSIYRENNVESTACSMQLKIGFNQKNVISNFNINAKILDFSLPMTETGRTFNIFHAFINGANSKLKKECKISDNDETLSFFKKYNNNYSDDQKTQFRINDLELWNKFYYLSNYFKFSYDEIIDIVNCLALILNLNEVTINKVKGDDGRDIFEIQQGPITKKICHNLNIKQKLFINQVSNFKSFKETKVFIKSFMKQTYYILFEFILEKINDHCSLYFNKISKDIGTNNFKRLKNIFFNDFPGEIEDKTLGGFSNNIANECLNMHAARGYYEIIEKLCKEKIFLNKFIPLKSYDVVSSTMGVGGIVDCLTKPLTKENYNSLLNSCLCKRNMINCIQFQENKSFQENDFSFMCSFTYKNIEYYFDSLYYESKELLYNDVINSIFAQSSNFIISSLYKEILVSKSKDFYSFFSNTLLYIFEPIKDIRPFNIFCFQSNEFYKIFHNDDEIKNICIPKNINSNIIKKSFILPVLYWNWFGYSEWIKIDEFASDYGMDFEKVKNRIVQINNLDPDRKNFNNNLIINFKKLPKIEIAKCTLSILAMKGDFLFGNEYILLKQGTLQKIRAYLNSMITTAEEMTKNVKNKLKRIKEYEHRRKSCIPGCSGKKLQIQYIMEINSTIEKKTAREKKSLIEKSFQLEKSFDFTNLSSLPNKKDFPYDLSQKNPVNNEQCVINIIKNNKILSKFEKNNFLRNNFNIFNVYNIISKKNEENLLLLENFPNSYDKKENKSPFVSSNANRNLETKLIIKIQSRVRGIISRKKCKILKYIYIQITLIQKFTRGLLTRLKFKKFKACLKKIKLIQRNYHRHYLKKISSAFKIQHFFHMKINSQKYRELLFAKKRAEAKNESFQLCIPDFVEFNQKNYALENKLRNLEIQKNFKNIWKENDPKKVTQLLLNNKNNYKRSNFNENIQNANKVLKVKDILFNKKRYKNNFNGKNKYEDEYPGEFLKRLQFVNLFKMNNLNEIKTNKDIINNYNLKKKMNKENKVKNIFDELYNEQQQNQKYQLNSFEYVDKKKNDVKYTLKDLIANEKFKQICKNYSAKNIDNEDYSLANENLKKEIYEDFYGVKKRVPLKNSYLSKSVSDSKSSDTSKL